MPRRCFFSFHYKRDNQRAAQIRQIGYLEGNRIVTDNEWESITRGGDLAIQRWINSQMQGKSCAIVLVGSETANRKWINYEIIKAWDSGIGVVGLRIHGLKNLLSQVSPPGDNPFDYIGYNDTGRALSSVVKCYNPPGNTSKERYAWIRQNLDYLIEEAVVIRKTNK